MAAKRRTKKPPPRPFNLRLKEAKFQQHVAHLFKTYRRKHKLTEGQLGKLIGLTLTWWDVRAIESCHSLISVVDLILIARFFKITVARLLKDGGVT
jgi:hypothetical protein